MLVCSLPKKNRKRLARDVFDTFFFNKQDLKSSEILLCVCSQVF